MADSHGARLIVIPLSFLRRLDSLKYTSVIALISIGYLVILVFAHFVKGDTMVDRGPLRLVQPQSAVAFLSSFPVIVFAYTCHQNVSPPLSLPSQDKFLLLTLSIRCSPFLTKSPTTRTSAPRLWSLPA